MSPAAAFWTDIDAGWDWPVAQPAQRQEHSSSGERVSPDTTQAQLTESTELAEAA